MKLERQVKLMSKYYCKGFGNTLLGVASKVIAYTDHPELRENIDLIDIYGELNKLEKYYLSIPFIELKSNADFAPLVLIRKLLDKLSKKVINGIDEPTEEAGKEVEKLRRDIWYLGEVYRTDLKEKIEELRKVPGYKAYRFNLKDIDRNTWKSEEAGFV